MHDLFDIDDPDNCSFTKCKIKMYDSSNAKSNINSSDGFEVVNDLEYWVDTSSSIHTGANKIPVDGGSLKIECRLID